MPHKPETPSVVPLAVTLAFTLPRPKSLPRRVEHHIRRPDLDNLVKAVKDALRGVFYRDDSQIIMLAATKAYGTTPGVVVTVEEVEAGPGRSAASMH